MSTRRGLWGRLWWDFTKSGAALAATLVLAGTAVAAALAPFLAEDRPLWLRDGGSPLLAVLGAEDLAWLTIVVAAAAAWIATRIGRRRAAGWCALGILVIGWTAAALRDDFNDPRRYALELETRRRIAEADRGAGDVASYQALREDAPQSLLPELSARRDLLRAGATRDDTRLAELVEENAERLEALESAVWPLVAHRADLAHGDRRYRTPGAAEGHPLGTDSNGRDVLSRLIHGTRSSLAIALATVLLATLIGVAVGATAGWSDGWADRILSRLTETFMCLPVLFVLFLMMAYLPSGRLALILVLAAVMWTHPARLVRAEVRRLREEAWVHAARALGGSPLRVVVRHVLPNALGPVMVSAALSIGTVILSEAALAFLGVGASDAASWGRMLREGHDAGTAANWHLVVFPGVAIFLTVLACNLVADRLRDVTAARR